MTIIDKLFVSSGDCVAKLFIRYLTKLTIVIATVQGKMVGHDHDAFEWTLTSVGAKFMVE